MRGVAIVAAVYVAVWFLFEQRSGNDAFLERVFAEMEAVRSVHTTSTGTMVMADGTVIRSAGEGDWGFSDNRRGWAGRFRNTYEECAFPSSSRSSLCSEEWVEVDGVSYVRETTDSGPGEWKIQDQLCSVSTLESPLDPLQFLDRLRFRYGLVESGEESIDGLAYRRFRGTWKAEEWMIERLEAGECEPPAKISREQMIAGLRRQAEETTRTVEVWVGRDDYRIWRIAFETEITRAIAPVPTRSNYVSEYSRYNEPVVIEPPS